MNSRFPEQINDPTLKSIHESNKNINKEVLAKYYFGDLHSGIENVRKIMANNPLFNHEESISFSTEDNRGRVFEQVKFILGHEKLSYEIDKVNPIEKLKAIYPMAEYNLALSVRFIVHIILYVDTLQGLGTEKHVSLINRAYSVKDYGSFGMTELGHGSNVAGVETTATYDPKTKGFILNSPTPTSAKWWIGAVANTANMSAIFAQLIIDGVNKGVHVFAVPIRDYETHEPFPGVIIGDCGKKISLEGIDNGFIMFNNYRVGYDCLLDRFSQKTWNNDERTNPWKTCSC